MKMAELEELFMRELNSLTAEELEQELFNVEPTGFGDFIHESKVFQLLYCSEVTRTFSKNVVNRVNSNTQYARKANYVLPEYSASYDADLLAA